MKESGINSTYMTKAALCFSMRACSRKTSFLACVRVRLQETLKGLQAMWWGAMKFSASRGNFFSSLCEGSEQPAQVSGVTLKPTALTAAFRFSPGCLLMLRSTQAHSVKCHLNGNLDAITRSYQDLCFICCNFIQGQSEDYSGLTNSPDMNPKSLQNFLLPLLSLWESELFFCIIVYLPC